MLEDPLIVGVRYIKEEDTPVLLNYIRPSLIDRRIKQLETDWGLQVSPVARAMYAFAIEELKNIVNIAQQEESEAYG